MASRQGLVQAILAYQEERGGAHRAGTLTEGPLSTMERYLENHFEGRSVRTVETGCGASTILLSQYAEKHTAFCYDDRQEQGSSVAFAVEFPSFSHDRVEWIFGPTQKTVPLYDFTEPVDLVLIDGPHGFPFAELEYYYFYQILEPDSVLILDDIHIPTLNNLFRFLCQDAMFHLGTVVGTTAFFHRSHAPALNPLGDDWWLQHYNMQRFPAYANDLRPGLKVPFNLTFDEGISDLDRYLPRGFILVDGKPITEGALSILSIALAPGLSGDVIVEIDVEFVAPDQREGAGCEILINLESAGVITAVDATSARHTVVKTVTPAKGNGIEVKFDSFGLKHAHDLEGFPSAGFDVREPGVFLHGVVVRRADEDVLNHISYRDGTIVSFTLGGAQFHFFADRRADSVQACHMVGRFYKEEELELIARYVKPGSRILDIGANIGNHTVYFEKVIGAAEVIAIEPLPQAVELLKLNAILNGLTRTDMSLLGVALGDRRTSGSASNHDPENLGGAVVTPNGKGSIPIEKGDDLFRGRAADFVKIDVQGYELNVVSGLRKLLKSHKPIVFVEVINDNIEKMKELMARFGYVLSEEYRHCEIATNFLFSPSEKAPRFNILARLRRGYPLSR